MLQNDSETSKASSEVLLGIPAPRTPQCPRAFAVYMASGQKRRAAKLPCGCNTCASCQPREAYRKALRAAVCMRNAVLAGQQLASAQIKSDDKARDADGAARRRKGSGGAVVVLSPVGELLHVVAAFDAGAKLPKGYNPVSLEEACALVGTLSAALRPAERRQDGRRGREMIGLRGGWAQKDDAPKEWHVVCRLGRAEAAAIRRKLDEMAVPSHQTRNCLDGAVWRVGWRWPESWTAEETALADLAVSGSAGMSQSHPQADSDKSRHATGDEVNHGAELKGGVLWRDRRKRRWMSQSRTPTKRPNRGSSATCTNGRNT